MEATIKETIKTNGDKYWERSFNLNESIERLKHFEGRGTEFKVKSGLELLWAKENFGKHGSWYAFLLKVGMSPDKAQRRMRLARQFMQWAKVKNVIQAMDLVSVKSCMLQDFASEVSQRVNLNDFLDRGYHPQGIKPQHILGASLGDLEKVVDRIAGTARRYYVDWTSIEKQEAKDTLQIFAERLLNLKLYIEELEQQSVKVQTKGMFFCLQAEERDRNKLNKRDIIQWLKEKEPSEATENLIKKLEGGS
jgi:hypothetical protein